MQFSCAHSGTGKEAIVANFLVNLHGSVFVADGRGMRVNTEGDAVTGTQRSYTVGGSGNDILHGDDTGRWSGQ